MSLENQRNDLNCCDGVQCTPDAPQPDSASPQANPDASQVNSATPQANPDAQVNPATPQVNPDASQVNPDAPQLDPGPPMMVSVETMRKSDAYTIAHLVPSKELMYRAGKGIFEAVCWRVPVGIVCGKGNNAGDGFVAALLMRESEIPCELLLTSDTFSEDGKYYFDKCRAAGVPYRMYGGEEDLTAFGSLLDCLFGTGFSGDVRPPYDRVIRRINESGAYVVSADINSGLNGDTGEGSLFVRSDLTVSIGTYKFGHFRGLADQAMKEKINIDIGIQIIET